MLEVYGPHSPKVEMHNAHKARMARIGAAIVRREQQVAAAMAEEEAAENKAQVKILETRLLEEIVTTEPWFYSFKEPAPLQEWQGPRIPRVEEIQRKTAEHYGVKRFDILSQRRTANIVRPRQVAMYLTKQLTLRSLPDIGRRFGGRDHTTVLHAVKKMERLVATDAALASTIATIRAGIAA